MSELCLFDKLWFWFLGSYFDNLKGWVDFFHHNLISKHSKGDKTTIFGDYFEAVQVVLLPIFSISVMRLCMKSALNQGLSCLWVGSLCTLRGQWDFFYPVRVFKDSKLVHWYLEQACNQKRRSETHLCLNYARPKSWDFGAYGPNLTVWKGKVTFLIKI